MDSIAIIRFKRILSKSFKRMPVQETIRPVSVRIITPDRRICLLLHKHQVCPIPDLGLILTVLSKINSNSPVPTLLLNVLFCDKHDSTLHTLDMRARDHWSVDPTRAKSITFEPHSNVLELLQNSGDVVHITATRHY